MLKKQKKYDFAGRTQEYVYWSGSAPAGICSAIAGLSIIGDVSSWNQPYGKIITAVLAIVPAVWAALDRAVRFSQLSVFNYGVSRRLLALYQLGSGLELDDNTKKLISDYNDILLKEHDAFAALISGSAANQADERTKKVEDEVKNITKTEKQP
jgi:hypothetical protein